MPRQLIPTLERYERVNRAGDDELLRQICLDDLFYLLVVACRRLDLRYQWFLDRCDEVRAAPNGYLDLWAREHGKSSVITFGLTLQDILRNPEITIGIFSHTRPLAKGFLRVLKRELENNGMLRDLFGDVLWRDPVKESPTWSEDSGLVVKRKGNPKESTLEAWGLVEGMPVGKHFDVLIMDDIVTKDNAASPEMREKTLEAWGHALNLGKRGGVRRMIGTRYHFGDAYGAILDRQAAIARVYPAEVDGEPVLLTREELDAKRRHSGPYVYASQMMLDPRQDSNVGFKIGWIRVYHGDADGNTYVIIDPANSKRKKSDYTAAWVITAAADRNYYVRWGTRDRLGLTERINLAMWLHREFQPMRFGYEEYGMQADIEAIRAEQNRQRYRFDITPLGGKLAKYDRIQGLQPLFEQGRIWFPQSLWVDITDTGERVDVLDLFRRHEYEAWPYSAHDDMLDSLARITDEDLGVTWPRASETSRARAHGRRILSRHEIPSWVA